MILFGLEDVAIEPALLLNPCFDPKFRSLAHLELDLWQKWPKLANLTLKYSHLTLKMTFDVVKNVTIELADPQIHPEIVPLVLLELILAQDSTKSMDSTKKPRAWQSVVLN